MKSTGCFPKIKFNSIETVLPQRERFVRKLIPLRFLCLSLNVLQAGNRTLAFHTHANADEMFYCIEGKFDIEFEDAVTQLCGGDLSLSQKERNIALYAKH